MLIIEIINKRHGTEEGTRDYHYRVRVNLKVIEEGWLIGHTRSNGWRTLAKKLVDAGSDCLITTTDEAISSQTPKTS